MRFAVIGTLFCGLLLAACGSLNAPRLEDRAFVGLRDQYSIATIGPERKLLPAPWRLMNFQPRSGAAAQLPSTRIDWVRMTWPDAQGDDENVRWRGPDAVLSHVSSNGLIWVAVVPWHPSVPDRTLDVMAKNIANDVSGSAFFDSFGSMFGKRVASKVLSGQVVKIGSQSGYRVTFDVVNLDQRELDENAPVTRVDLVLVPVAVATKLYKDGGDFWARGLMMMFHKNDVAAYEQTVSDFDWFLTQFRFPAPKTSN